MSEDAQMHVGLERIIAPRLRAGVQVALTGAALLILFVPRYGLLASVVPSRICWILSSVSGLILAVGAAMVIILPGYYRRLSRLMKLSPEQMRVTLRLEPAADGETKVLAELRPFDAEPQEPVFAVVEVMEQIDIPPHTPARVYGKPERGPVVIDTIDGILWPEPDDRQKKLEHTFRVRS